ncbi:hypothetical protein KAMAJI_00760 [Serratia phage vB_SmaM-Kamaji]|nr:hypothetical protein KAMAJI_00760 [Serratia phage vB_SmaM-Kamaji]
MAKLKATEVGESRYEYRVYMLMGYTELYIDISKEDGSCTCGSIHPNSDLGVQALEVARKAIRRYLKAKQ